MSEAVFHGVKALLYCGMQIAVLRRDDIPTIPWPGRVDLPGGARDGDESVLTCGTREIFEETGLKVAEARFHWRQFNPDPSGMSGSWFIAAEITQAESAAMRLGDEGQALWMMDVGAYLAAADAIPRQQERVRRFWQAEKGGLGT